MLVLRKAFNFSNTLPSLNHSNLPLGLYSSSRERADKLQGPSCCSFDVLGLLAFARARSRLCASLTIPLPLRQGFQVTGKEWTFPNTCYVGIQNNDANSERLVWGNTDRLRLDRRDKFFKQVLSNHRNDCLRDGGIVSMS